MTSIGNSLNAGSEFASVFRYRCGCKDRSGFSLTRSSREWSRCRQETRLCLLRFYEWIPKNTGKTSLKLNLSRGPPLRFGPPAESLKVRNNLVLAEEDRWSYVDMLITRSTEQYHCKEKLSGWWSSSSRDLSAKESEWNLRKLYLVRTGEVIHCSKLYFYGGKSFAPGHWWTKEK